LIESKKKSRKYFFLIFIPKRKKYSQNCLCLLFLLFCLSKYKAAEKQENLILAKTTRWYIAHAKQLRVNECVALFSEILHQREHGLQQLVLGFLIEQAKCRMLQHKLYFDHQVGKVFGYVF
jgi:hypothetical protein